MGINRWHLLAPVAADLSTKDIVDSLVRSRRKSLVHDFSDAVQRYLKARHVFLVNSGRNALFLILKSLSSMAPEKTEVIVPAYTCPSVGIAVQRAGLKLKLCDLSKNSLDYDSEDLQRSLSRNTLAIVATHFFGYPSDLGELAGRAREAGCFLIEDAAQAWGAEFQGKKTGTFGDVGFLSLGIGKGFTVGAGGVIVTNREDIASCVERAIGRVISPNFYDRSRVLFKILASSFLLKPRPFFFLGSLLPNGRSEEESCSVKSIGDFQSALGLRLLERLDGEIVERNKRGSALYKALHSTAGLTLFKPPAESRPASVRFPMLFDDPVMKRKIFKKLHDRGIRAGTLYDRPLNEYPLWNDASGRSFPNGKSFSEGLLTMPIHGYVTSGDLNRIIDTIGSTLQ